MLRRSVRYKKDVVDELLSEYRMTVMRKPWLWVFRCFFSLKRLGRNKYFRTSGESFEGAGDVAVV